MIYVLIGVVVASIIFLILVVHFTKNTHASQEKPIARGAMMGMFIHPALLDTPEARQLMGESITPPATGSTDQNKN